MARKLAETRAARLKRGVAAGRSAVYPEARLAARSAERGTSAATTGGGGRSAPDPDRLTLTMLDFVGRRLLQSVPVLVLASLVVFSVLHLVPGDPIDAMMGASAFQSGIIRQDLVVQ